MAVYTALDIAKETAVDLFENVHNPWGDAVKTRKDTVESPQTVELATVLQIALMNGSPDAVEAIAPSLGLSKAEFTRQMQMRAENLAWHHPDFRTRAALQSHVFLLPKI